MAASERSPREATKPFICGGKKEKKLTAGRMNVSALLSGMPKAGSAERTDVPDCLRMCR